MSEPGPDYDSLKRRATKEWLTEGPNSGGVEGLLLVDAQIWWFVADWEPRVYAVPMAVEDFLARYGDSDQRGYREAVAFLRGG